MQFRQGHGTSRHRGKCKRENREERIKKMVVVAVPVTSGTQQPSVVSPLRETIG